MGLRFEHRQHKWLNNRAENFHQSTRLPEKVMRRYQSACQLQRFLSVHDQVANQFMHCPYNCDSKQKQKLRTQAFAACNEVSYVKMEAV